jgi:hypothetical protein
MKFKGFEKWFVHGSGKSIDSDRLQLDVLMQIPSSKRLLIK